MFQYNARHAPLGFGELLAASQAAVEAGPPPAEDGGGGMDAS